MGLICVACIEREIGERARRGARAERDEALQAKDAMQHLRTVANVGHEATKEPMFADAQLSGKGGHRFRRGALAQGVDGRFHEAIRRAGMREPLHNRGLELTRHGAKRASAGQPVDQRTRATA
jgi:hypothetical protein